MTASADGTVGAVGIVGFLHAAGAVEAFIESRLSEAGLSIPKLAALTRLVQAGGSLPLGQLADRLACVKSNVTQLVDRLDADGYVTREPDPNDRRSRLAVLTDAGRDACRQGERLQQEAEQHLFGALSANDHACLAAVLEKLERARR